MKLLIAVASVGLLAAGSALAQAPLPPQTKPAPGSPAAGHAPTSYAMNTSTFLKTTTEIDRFQREAAHLALKRATAPGALRYAHDVLRAHTKHYAKLLAAYGDPGQTPDMQLSPAHKLLIRELRHSPASSFDMKYIDFEVLVLKQTLGPLETYATGGVNARLRQASADAVEAVKAELTEARNLQNSNKQQG